MIKQKDKTLVFFSILLLLNITVPAVGQYEVLITESATELAKFHNQSEHISKIKEPVLMPLGSGFERDRVYNPTVIVEENMVYMIYRAEGAATGTGAFGLAESMDGVTFKRYENNPILISEKNFEKGGCEDPRIIKINKTYYLFYVGNSDLAPGKICIATSENLYEWKKHGSILQPVQEWEKNQIKAPAPILEKINGKYCMYYQGEKEAWKTKIGMAVSDDLLNWKQASAKPVMLPRQGYFDSWGVEPGVAVIIDEGILLIYNGWGGDSTNINKTGWALFNKNDPMEIITRCTSPIIELADNHVFTEGLINFNDKWYLYYGAADRRIEAAIINIEQLIASALKL